MIDAVVKINDIEVFINGNPTLERNIKEELDTGKIVIHSIKATRYEMYDKVDITTPYYESEQYLVQADNVIQLNATMYEHTLTLFENIGYFNTIYPADRSFKLVGQTLEEILTVYQRELSAYHNIEISWDDIPQTVLDETIPYKEFAGLNFSAILLSLFRKIWAVPKVTRIGTVWDIYPLYHNERNNSISTDSISKMSQQNNVDYATQVKSQLKNAVNERLVGEVTWFPSESGYIKPRSSTLVKQDSKLRYELDSNIVSILKAEAVDVHYTVYNTVTTNVDDVYLTVDITSQIVQDEIWDLLPVITSIGVATIAASDNAKNHIRYQVGKPYITNLYEAATDKLIFTQDTYYLRWAIMREVTRNETTYFDPTYYTGSNPAIQPLATEDVKMRFKYVRQRNIDLIHNRKTKGVMNDSTTIHSQRDASVEVNEYKKNLKIYSNRMGNNENSKTKVFVYPATPYELFDYTDDNTIVTRVQNTYHNTYVYCEYEESENFSNIEAEYALMRRSDPYTISSKSVTTNLIVQEYIEFSVILRTLNTRLTDNARKLLLGLFEPNSVPYDKVAVGVFKPVLASWNSDYSIHMPVEASGDGNLITVHVQFPHQTIAGKTYYDLDTDTYQTYLNPLPYTDEDGRLTDFELYFTPDILFEDSGQYPLILSETLYLADKYTDSDIQDPLDLDGAASFAETFQVSFVADDNIYIGNAMAKENYFIKDQILPAESVKIYTSTKPYGQYDQSVRSYDTDNTANISLTYSFANRTITITPSIAVEYFSIVYSDDILLAVNKSLASGETYIIYINHVKDIVLIALNARATDLASISGTASIVYTLILLEAQATSLSSVSGTASILYTLINLTANGTNLIAVSGTSAIEYTMRIYAIVGNAISLTSISGTSSISYTEKLYSISANASSLESISGTASFTFSEVTYTVRFLDWDSDVLKTQQVASGDDATAPNNPSRTGYDFDGWDRTYTNITSDLDVYATYVVQTFNVNFIVGLDLWDNQTVNYGEDAVTPTNPPDYQTTNYDYTFTGWSNPYTNITSDLNTGAVFEETVREDVEWVQITSGVQSGTECLDAFDVGNILRVTSDPSCVYEANLSYPSQTNISTPPPPCTDGAEYILCLYNGFQYTCTKYTGVIYGGTNTFYECKFIE